MKLKHALIIGCFLLIASIAAAQEIHMVVCLHITKDSITSTCTKVFQGSPKDYVLDYPESFTGKVYSLKNELLYNFTFEKSFTVFADPSGSYEADELDTEISFPHYRNIGRLEVWDGREKKLDLDLSAYATCNEDGVCDSFESEAVCPEDCRDRVAAAKEPAEIEKVPTGAAERPEPAPKSKNNLIIIGVVAGVLVILVLWLLLSKRKQNQ